MISRTMLRDGRARAGALEVAPSAAGRMCDRLVRKGVIRRHRARADRRSVLVSVTAAGRQVVDQATTRRRMLIEGILAKLPADNPAGGRRDAAGVRRPGRGGARQHPLPRHLIPLPVSSPSRR